MNLIVYVLTLRTSCDQIQFFWVVTSCSAVVGFQRFRGWRQHEPLERSYPTITL